MKDINFIRVFDIFIVIFFGMYYFIIIFRKLCFGIITMQRFLKLIKSNFLNEYLVFYWALIHPVFKITFQLDCLQVATVGVFYAVDYSVCSSAMHLPNGKRLCDV